MFLALRNGLRAVIAVVLFGTAVPAAAVTVFLDPMTQHVAAPAKASVDLRVSGLGDGMAPSLGGFDVSITFDPAVLMFDEVTFGTSLGDETIGNALGGFDASVPGTVSVDLVSFLFDFELNAGQPAAFLLATLRFTPVTGSGTSSVAIASAVLSDAAANTLANVTLGPSSEVTVVPEPSSGLLLGAALLGLCRLRRRSPA